ncbi:hypothetical protein E1200_17535 [Actinomadura sp. GC306]|uniref:hypothetical protein n=1 Tax=Actinomadura sp. GC306 TaxID=2530367 RepID=UPI00104921EF|nr:hypothetical protein [Actinomadura sp. GC306]TDC65933.1 hypothetical protein E1200_17535 [Actinomadura sp. GC306]
MGPDEAEAKVKLATTRYRDLAEQAEAAKEALFDAYAEAAHAGSTADELAAEAPFTAGYIRRRIRERGVEPARGGPKRRRKDMP